jgi:hypothetical protein
MSRILWSVLFAALLLGGAIFVLRSTAQLPALVACHFVANGMANGFMTRGEFLHFSMGLDLGLPLLVTVALAWLPRRVSGLLNIPNREYWLAPERREKTLDDLALYGLRMGCLLAGFLILVQALVVQANARHPPQLSANVLLGVLAWFFVSMAVWAIGLSLRFRKNGG